MLFCCTVALPQSYLYKIKLDLIWDCQERKNWQASRNRLSMPTFDKKTTITMNCRDGYERGNHSLAFSPYFYYHDVVVVKNSIIKSILSINNESVSIIFYPWDMERVRDSQEFNQQHRIPQLHPWTFLLSKLDQEIHTNMTSQSLENRALAS